MTTARPSDVRRISSYLHTVSTAISVADLDASVAFYGHLGFRVAVRRNLPELDAEVAYLRLRTLVLELVRIAGSAPNHRPGPPAQYSVQGLAQLTLYVDDIDAAFAAARAAKLPLDSEVIDAPALGVRVFYLHDVDHNTIEIAEQNWPKEPHHD